MKSLINVILFIVERHGQEDSLEFYQGNHIDWDIYYFNCPERVQKEELVLCLWLSIAIKLLLLEMFYNSWESQYMLSKPKIGQDWTASIEKNLQRSYKSQTYSNRAITICNTSPLHCNNLETFETEPYRLSVMSPLLVHYYCHIPSPFCNAIVG